MLILEEVGVVYILHVYIGLRRPSQETWVTWLMHMSDIRKLIGQAIIFMIRVMLQAQSVFILGIYEGEYPPPKKKTIKFILVFGPRILHCYKKPVAHPGGMGDASLPAPTVHRNWPFWGPKLEKKIHPPPHGSASTTSPSTTAKSYKLLWMNDIKIALK